MHLTKTAFYKMFACPRWRRWKQKQLSAMLAGTTTPNAGTMTTFLLELEMDFRLDREGDAGTTTIFLLGMVMDLPRRIDVGGDHD